MEAAGNKKKQLPNPRAKANIFEVFTFSWILNFFKTGQKRNLETNDLYTPLNDDKSSLLGLKFEKIWKIEVANAKSTNREPSLSRVIVRTFFGNILFNGLVHVFTEMILRMIQPILIGRLLAYFNHSESNIINSVQAYMYASGLLLNMLAIILLYHYSQVEMMHLGMKIRVACCSVIYKKALKLNGTSLSATTVGQVVNLISNDVNRIDIAFKHIHYLWVGPLQSILVTYYLWQEIGLSSIIGITVFLVLVPWQGWLGKKTSDYRLKTAPSTDERVKLMNEIISGIQIIKMYTWEKPFALLVKYARKIEIEQIKEASWIKVFLQSFRIFHFRFALFISILSYVLLGNNINTQQVFVIISYYGILFTMTVCFPQGVITLAEMLISNKRIQSFLLQDEKEKHNKPLLLKSETTSKNGIEMSNINSDNNTENGTSNEKDMDQLDNFGIDVLNASAKWILNQPENSLNNINLSVRPGRLVAIIGPVGAGKSSLIQAILRELPLCEGSISVCGTLSYASQEPWLFNGSIQQNILFGSPMDYNRYEEVIKVCALKTDFKQLPYGDRSLVGERGVSLSGGQRARVNLARAIYKQADIYLLDDPLSAVDTHVGKHIFEKCIKDYLKKKTCILITHQIQYLSSVDHIVLMENANILAEGSYQELQSSGLDFTKLLKSSDETADSEIDDTKATINNSVEQLSSLSRQGSIGSISSSIDDDKLNETRAEPIEVAETRSFGNVSRSIYLSYISAGGNAFTIAFLLFICIFTQILGTGGDYWISYWVNLEDNVFRNTESKSMNISNFITGALFDTPMVISREFCVIIYSIINIALLVVIVIRCAMFVSVLMSASMNLHNNMFNAIIRATIYFFNTNPSGRILNRFTYDIGAIDEVLLMPLLDFVSIALQLLGTLVVVGIINVYLLIPTFIIGLMCYSTVYFYLSTSRSIKRLEAVSRSPVYGYLNASLQGISTIRAFQTEDVLSKEFDDHQDLHSSAWYLFISSSEAFGFSLDIICFIYICILTFSFLIVNNGNFVGDVGLVLTQAISMTGALQRGIRQLIELDNQMISVERVIEYTNVAQEAALESSPDKKPSNEWPDKGQIVFDNFYLRYSLDAAHVLKHLNIQIQAMEKIGIVGRTGAGKSSLIGALFRLALNEGNITIDGIEIHEIGLHDLRSKISIIPQEPILFSGSMRKNLDPLNEYPDHALWNALEEVELKTIVEDLPDGLNSKMSEGGSNFSVGQRQLVCLARAIVRCNKILVLDEATANVDSQTDALIQKTIRNKFRSCTVLTIAHRLNTVMDSDRVLVMDAGTIVEFDHPYKLLKNKDGFFYKMVEQTGSETFDFLYKIAVENFMNIAQENNKFTT
ncbi:probable multidrug resistance-associated protein lethal(2)03659 isoform X1 [Rhopalosiphum maidis]|uniref:probable multidrug resistance-associated protein lethal(2)03659 isoform X1 n=2 Tax=Rhopalosiphum maidis TaxID=43146 RepID=UPI000EFE41BA|nr:probable multidrug resistance-associated protein lethal(2)03659 isoform X1 [Rhopalosiphum maidis]XP_026805620.1 probable multidrug resistance-associated protein lethal(2)03659 isoform X1 [Rhopalosiphum maidis]XP_026805621.1 probable multidrug resistance-associated protein lethal(2)03659 isoform X1 [Rhopalosiphum maidis]XP_026805622.1 probable multidrug resistance-associated protein lethal(2)03659 isoform X1 [Rhopalosiphum maidis]XP_026805623.1 probable multidrug resistance-associated protein